MKGTDKMILLIGADAHSPFRLDTLKAALARAAGDVAAFARKEGLTAHARSALIRTEEKEAET